MKKLFKVIVYLLAALAAIFIALVAWGYFATGNARELGTQFVQHLSASETDKAYAMLHKNLKRKLTPEAFGELVKQGNLNTLSSVEWSAFNKADGIDTISGSGETRSGVKVNAQIQVTEIENDGAPGILSFDFKQAE